MVAAFNDVTCIHHQYLVSVHDRGQAVRNHQRCLVAGNALQLRLNGALVGTVQRAR